MTGSVTFFYKIYSRSKVCLEQEYQFLNEILLILQVNSLAMVQTYIYAMAAIPTNVTISILDIFEILVPDLKSEIATGIN